MQMSSVWHILWLCTQCVFCYQTPLSLCDWSKQQVPCNLISISPPQVFVETLDKCFENVCELDLIFHVDKVRCTEIRRSPCIYTYIFWCIHIVCGLTEKGRVTQPVSKVKAIYCLECLWKRMLQARIWCVAAVRLRLTSTYSFSLFLSVTYT